MDFEEWFDEYNYQREYPVEEYVTAKAAWGYQQERIDHLESIIKANQIRPRGKSMLAHLPQGYVFVPVEPTEKMVEAGLVADTECPFVDDVYKAMIHAAQELDDDV